MGHKDPWALLFKFSQKFYSKVSGFTLWDGSLVVKGITPVCTLKSSYSPISTSLCRGAAICLKAYQNMSTYVWVAPMQRDDPQRHNGTSVIRGPATRKAGR